MSRGYCRKIPSAAINQVGRVNLPPTGLHVQLVLVIVPVVSILSSEISEYHLSGVPG